MNNQTEKSKMRVLNGPMIAGAAYVAFFVGLSSGWVGEIPNCSSEPFSWVDPLKVAALFGVPFVLGLLAGKETTPPHPTPPQRIAWRMK